LLIKKVKAVMKLNSDFWIAKLGLKEHPEGGYFKETYRSEIKLCQATLPERFDGERALFTAIYFLLTGEQVSHFHRLKADELWHFYCGSALTIHVIDRAGKYYHLRSGPNFESGEVFQAVIKNGSWLGATVDNKDSYSLVGCSVSPGFDYQDFELGKQSEMIARYPEQTSIIKKLAIK